MQVTNLTKIIPCFRKKILFTFGLQTIGLCASGVVSALPPLKIPIYSIIHYNNKPKPGQRYKIRILTLKTSIRRNDCKHSSERPQKVLRNISQVFVKYCVGRLNSNFDETSFTKSVKTGAPDVPLYSPLKNLLVEELSWRKNTHKTICTLGAPVFYFAKSA